MQHKDLEESVTWKFSEKEQELRGGQACGVLLALQFVQVVVQISFIIGVSASVFIIYCTSFPLSLPPEPLVCLPCSFKGGR